MDTAIAAAAEIGGNKLLLTAAAKNEVARKFFETFVFRATMIEMTLNTI